MSEDDADRAAEDLDAKLRDQPWFISTGVGETVDGHMIFLYVKSAAGPKRFHIGNSWKGVPVTIRVVGSIRKIALRASAAA